jgi:hypothetical protein
MAGVTEDKAIVTRGAPASHTAAFITSTGHRTLAPFDSILDTYTLDGVEYQYVGTSDGVAFYREARDIERINLAIVNAEYAVAPPPVYAIGSIAISDNSLHPTHTECRGLGPWCEDCGDCLICYGEDACTVTGEPHS